LRFASIILVAISLSGLAAWPRMAAAQNAKATPRPDARMRAASGRRETRAVAKGAPRAQAAPRTGPVELYSVNSRESLLLRLRDDRGRPLKGVQKRFDHFLRCHHTNVQHPMSPRLVRVLYQVGRHFPGHRVEVVSGYRHPSVAKNPHSPHMQGLACDFRVPGVRNADLRDYLRRDFQKVGVGYYPNSSFVHLDVRKDKSAFWIDYSGPGDRAVYSENPTEDLETGRSDGYKPTKIDEAWIDEPETDSRGHEQENEEVQAESRP
jgi:uncharacterized protein YcbK (DUF882 family)